MHRPMPLPRSDEPRGRSWPSLAAVAVLTAAALGACSDRVDDRGEGGLTVPTTEAPAATAPTGGGTAAPDLSTTIRLHDLDLGLESTIAASLVPDSDSVLVAERAGRIHEVVLGGETGDPTATVTDGPLLDIEDRVRDTSGERGLLGVAVAPDGGSVVVSYTAGVDGSSHLERYELTGEPGDLTIDETSRRTLLTLEQPYPNHNGGHVVFGPDGMLYAGFGDGGSRGDPEGRAQDPTTLLGKILRIDPGAADLVPADNPFVDRPDGARPEIWLTGVRNPWQFSFDAETGDVWVADVGQDTWEEIDLLRASDGGGRGANLGWDLFEGDEPFDSPDPAPRPWSAGPFVEPIHTYGRDEGCSVTGGAVYRGSAVPGLVGAYLFADYCGSGVRALVPPAGDGDATSVADLRGGGLAEIVGFAAAPRGELLVISLRLGVFALRAG